MLRWIDTHNHLFVLSEEQQKKELWEARRRLFFGVRGRCR